MQYQHHSPEDEGRRRGQAGSIDYLKIRLHRMVVLIIKRELESNSSFPVPNILTSKEKHPLIKVISLALFGMCFAIFTYQLYDRISHYFTYPVAVDVFVTQPAIQQFPEVTICYSGVKVLKPKKYKQCNKDIFYYFDDKSSNRPIEEIWKEVNTSTGLISAHEVKGVLTLRLEHADQPLVHGTCTTFRSSKSNATATGDHYLNITLETPENCEAYTFMKVYVHDPGEGPMSRNTIVYFIDKNGELSITKRKFVFVNRKDNICLTNLNRQECIDDCLKEAIIRMQADKCRFPFYPPKMNNITAQCAESREVSLEWNKLFYYLTGVDGETGCQCPRKCEHTAFGEWIKAGEITNDTWTFILRFRSPYETLIKERLSYDLLDLLCDVGGNSGLFIGVSLLSLFQLGHIVVRSGKKYCQPKSKQFSANDPLYRKVIKTYNNWKKQSNGKDRLVNKEHQGRVALYFKRIVALTCICFLIMLCGNRLCFYLQYPTETIVVISFNTSLEAPTMILCFGDENVMKLQWEFGKYENISNPCDVNVWELFNLPNISVGNVWPKNDIISPVPEYGEYPLVPFYEGSCYDLSEATIMVPSNKMWEHSFVYPGQCGTDSVKMYIKPSTGKMDYHHYTHISSSITLFVKYLIKEIHIEESGIPCISREENEQCTLNCLNRKLFNVISCRLPYMLEGDLPLCRSSSSVRQAHLAFRDLFFISENVQDCNCLPKCLTQIIETTEQSLESNSEMFSFLYSSQDNIVESYVLKRSYSFVKLLCDIGGLLGSITGMCILDIIETALSFLTTDIKNSNRS